MAQPDANNPESSNPESSKTEASKPDTSKPDVNKIVLGPQCWIKGQMRVDGDLQMLGQYEGEMHVGGTLEVCESATVKGIVRAGAARVSGKVEADLIAEQGIALLAGCHVTGRLFSPRILAVKGATVRAEVCIGPDAVAQADALNLYACQAAAVGADKDEVLCEQDDAAQAQEGNDTGADLHTDIEESMSHVTQTPAPMSVAAAMDDADDECELEAQPVADISTVPQSIRAVLQRRPRLASLSTPPRRTA